MALFTLGINHRTAQLTVREQVAFHSEELRRALADLSSSGRVVEAAILSTCNRTELYCQADDRQLAGGTGHDNIELGQPLRHILQPDG